ncbi:MAG TPA: GlsB/YeaQ/YmgE family stress response membrane protein [Armatimonadota bacterium]|nr:GlsB/YeaQ/YmgE family stress response membrane protein [Armatimonadota bacterium]
MAGHVWWAWIIIGIIAGAIARMIVPGEAGGGILMDMVIGLIGAVIGGWVSAAIFGGSGAGAGGSWIWSIIISVFGAVILLLLVRLFTGRRTTTTV